MAELVSMVTAVFMGAVVAVMAVVLDRRWLVNIFGAYVER
jgi:hypothetical protein